MTPVEVPKVGNTVEECIIGEWRKHKGDQVAAGEVIAEIETDKTTFEITAPVSGTILEVFVTQGSFVPVFTQMCVIGEPGEELRRPQSGSGRRWCGGFGGGCGGGCGFGYSSGCGSNRATGIRPP